MNDHEGMIIVGIFSLAIIAAIQGNWSIAGLAVSGGFAFLKGSQTTGGVTTQKEGSQ